MGTAHAAIFTLTVDKRVMRADLTAIDTYVIIVIIVQTQAAARCTNAVRVKVVIDVTSHVLTADLTLAVHGVLCRIILTVGDINEIAVMLAGLTAINALAQDPFLMRTFLVAISTAPVGMMAVGTFVATDRTNVLLVELMIQVVNSVRSGTIRANTRRSML